MENVIFMFIGAALALAGVAYFGRSKSGKLPESKQDYKMPDVRPPRPDTPSPKVTEIAIPPLDRDSKKRLLEEIKRIERFGGMGSMVHVHDINSIFRINYPGNRLYLINSVKSWHFALFLCIGS